MNFEITLKYIESFFGSLFGEHRFEWMNRVALGFECGTQTYFKGSCSKEKVAVRALD